MGWTYGVMGETQITASRARDYVVELQCGAHAVVETDIYVLCQICWKTSTGILVLSEHFWDIICSVWIIYE